MTKSELRVIYKEKRSELTVEKMDKLNDLLLINFQKLQLPSVHCVHTYLASLRLGEVDTAPIVRYLQFRNPELKIAVPKVDNHSSKMFHLFLNQNMEMAPNRYGIDEPLQGEKVDVKELDLVLVPLIAFDERGNRVGYGKGFYDKFLSECRKDVVSVGLSFFDAVERIDDINTFDVPLHYCVTPTRIYTF